MEPSKRVVHSRSVHRPPCTPEQLIEEASEVFEGSLFRLKEYLRGKLRELKMGQPHLPSREHLEQDLVTIEEILKDRNDPDIVAALEKYRKAKEQARA